MSWSLPCVESYTKGTFPFPDKIMYFVYLSALLAAPSHYWPRSDQRAMTMPQPISYPILIFPPSRKLLLFNLVTIKFSGHAQNATFFLPNYNSVVLIPVPNRILFFSERSWAGSPLLTFLSSFESSKLPSEQLSELCLNIQGYSSLKCRLFHVLPANQLSDLITSRRCSSHTSDSTAQYQLFPCCDKRATQGRVCFGS